MIIFKSGLLSTKIFFIFNIVIFSKLLKIYFLVNNF